MARHQFTSEEAAEAGRKSRRGEDKAKKKLRDYIAKILSDEVRAEKELAKLSGEAYWSVLFGLLKFALPKSSFFKKDFVKIQNQKTLAAPQGKANLTPKNMCSGQHPAEKSG